MPCLAVNRKRDEDVSVSTAESEQISLSSYHSSPSHSALSPTAQTQFSSSARRLSYLSSGPAADASRFIALENTACRANSIADEEKDLLSAPLSVAGPASSMALEEAGGGCDARGRREAGGDNVGRPIDKYRTVLSDVREDAVYNTASSLTSLQTTNVGGEGADDGGGREGGGGGVVEAEALKWQQKQASYVMILYVLYIMLLHYVIFTVINFINFLGSLTSNLNVFNVIMGPITSIYNQAQNHEERLRRRTMSRMTALSIRP